MAVVPPLNNFMGPEGDTVTVAQQLLNTEYWLSQRHTPLHGHEDIQPCATHRAVASTTLNPLPGNFQAVCFLLPTLISETVIPLKLVFGPCASG